MKNSVLTAFLCLAGPALFAQFAQLNQQSYPMIVELGRLDNGAQVSFIQDFDRNYNLQIAGAPIVQPRLARIEVYRADDDIQRLNAGYKTVQK